MNDVPLSVRVDKKTKENVIKMAKDLGISTAAFVNAVLKNALTKSELTLYTSDSLYDKAFVKKIKSAESRIKKKDFVEFKSKEEAYKHFLKGKK